MYKRKKQNRDHKIKKIGERLRFRISNNSMNQTINILNKIKKQGFLNKLIIISTDGRHESSTQRSIVDVNGAKCVTCPVCIA